VPISNEFILIILKGKQLKCNEYNNKCTYANGWYGIVIRRTYFMKHEFLRGDFDWMCHCGKLHQHLDHAALADTF
jgi:hypothetical protein